jgi:hypothetical protein
VYSRLATLLLVFLTIGFFIYHKLKKNDATKELRQVVASKIAPNDYIVHDEFLILMDEGDEKYLNDVLVEFDIEMIAPLGEWVLVARNEANIKQRIIALNSNEAKENIRYLKKIEAHPAVHSAHLNFIQSDESIFGCKPADNINNSDAIKAASDAKIIPKDTYLSYQWHLSKNTGVNLLEAWNITVGNPSTVIAVVDRNFLPLGLDLSQCMARQYYYENILDYFAQKKPNINNLNKHGAYILSVLAPCTDNAIGLAGIDWHAQVFSIDTKSDSSMSSRLFGILWAAGIDVCTQSITGCTNHQRFQKNMHPANIINASFGFVGTSFTDPPYGPVLDVIGQINRQRKIIVASVGNEGSFADRRLPGAAGGVISVGSSNKKRQSSNFSNFGRTVDILAPGEDIVGLDNDDLILLNGTSFSAPIVAGVISLMHSINPILVWKHAEYILKETATKMVCDDYCPSSMKLSAQKLCRSYCCNQDEVICAKGIVNAKKALQMAELGIPNTALIDVDDYYLPLSDDNGLKGKVVLKNWGRKRAIVKARTTDKNLKIVSQNIIIDPIDPNGMPGLAEMIVFYDGISKRGLIASLIFEAANIDQPYKFNDRIEAIVEIVPDPKIAPPKKILKELSYY